VKLLDPRVAFLNAMIRCVTQLEIRGTPAFLFAFAAYGYWSQLVSWHGAQVSDDVAIFIAVMRSATPLRRKPAARNVRGKQIFSRT
jgi:hypothetical protein